jgi:hypothetical protein
MGRIKAKSRSRRIPKMGERVEDIEKKHKFSYSEKKESQSTVFLIIGLILIFIVIGAGILLILFSGIFTQPTPPGPPVIINQTNDTNITQPICDDLCNLNLAITTSSPNFCENINSSSITQQCYLSLANISLGTCIKLENTSQLFDCVLVHAKAANDSKICNNLNEPDKTSCMNKINECYEKTGSERDVCLAIDQKNVSLCKSNEECIYNYSKLLADSSACNSLPTAPTEYACKSYVLNQDKCINLPLGSQKDFCYEIYANLSGDGLICTSIQQDTIYSYNCLTSFAIKKEDLSYCDYLSLNDRWACYTNYSFVTNDLNGCKNIDMLATTARFKCFYDFAKYYGDPSACDPIKDPSPTITCYVAAIMNNTNLDYTKCGAVIISQWKNKCYMQSAKLKNDSSICNFIQTESERKNCFNELD